MRIGRNTERATERERELVKIVLDGVEELVKTTFYAEKINIEVFVQNGHADAIGLHKDCEYR